MDNQIDQKKDIEEEVTSRTVDDKASNEDSPKSTLIEKFNKKSKNGNNR